jgi:multisubunit Na+/H+ antiporter MnhB subunit
MMGTAFDLLLAGTLLAVAWRIVYAPDPFESVVVFITFGLLMAMVWARLAAPDIALAEAAIGAGLTGVLLLDTLAVARGGVAAPPVRGRHAGDRVAALGTGLLACLLVAAVLALPRMPTGLAGDVSAGLDRSGVSQPVTAVLLNFRGYDTWLELGVLLIAVIGVMSLAGCGRLSAAAPPEKPGAVLAWLVRVLVPMVVLVAGYLLWLGKTAAGGAFQAGVVLGAAGVLLWLAGRRPLRAEWAWKILLVLGFASFAAVGAAGGGLFMEFAPERAGFLILLIEIAATLSVAAAMAALFIALYVSSGRKSRSEAEGGGS